MSDHSNDNQPDISLCEVFGQELEQYLYTPEAQDTLADHSLYDEEPVKRRGFSDLSHLDHDPFFDDFSSEEMGVNTEDLFGMSVLVPMEEFDQQLKVI